LIINDIIDSGLLSLDNDIEFRWERGKDRRIIEQIRQRQKERDQRVVHHTALVIVSICL